MCYPQKIKLLLPSFLPSVCLSISRPSVDLSIRLCILSPFLPFVHLSAISHIRLSFHPSVHASERPSFLPFVCLSIYSSVHPSVHPFFLSPFLPFVHLSAISHIRLSFHPSFHASERPSFLSRLLTYLLTNIQ